MSPNTRSVIVGVAAVVIFGGLIWYASTRSGVPNGNLTGTPSEDTTAPTVPSDLSVAGKTAQSVFLTWVSATDDVGVANYVVYMNGAELITVDGTSYEAANLAANTPYTFMVRARDAAGNESPDSNTVSVTTLAQVVTGPPITFVSAPGANAVLTGTVTIEAFASAFDNAGVTHVELYRATGEGPLVFVERDGAMPYRFDWNTRAVANGRYVLQVRATDGRGRVSQSNSITVFVDNPAVGDTEAPTISAVNERNITASSAEIRWATDEKADSLVEYGLSSNYGATSGLGTSLVTNHSVTISGLAVGTTYHYRVISKDAAGNRVVSSDRTFKTIPAPTISITSPRPAAKVSGMTTISTSLANAAGADIAYAEFYKIEAGNAVKLGADTSAPYSYRWDTRAEANGSYTLEARIYGPGAVLIASSGTVTVTVAN